MKRAVVAGLLVAAAGLTAAVWWRGRAADEGRAGPTPPPPTLQGPPAVVAPGPGSSGGAVAAGPPGAVAPVPPIAIPPPAPTPPVAVGPSVAFEDEARDAAWADEHERELGRRLRGVVDALRARGVSVVFGAPICRRTLCRVAIASPDEAALGKTYGVLETEDGLLGWADTLLLEAVTVADGRVDTAVVAQFARD